MTVTPDPDKPDQPVEPVNPDKPDQPVEPVDDQARPPADQPTDAVTSVTAEPDPAPAEPEAPAENGHEVEGETTRASAAHTVAFPGPIPDYAMEPSVERPARAQAADPVDTAPTRQHPDDAGFTVPLTVPLTLDPRHPLPPEPPGLAPEQPHLAPAPPTLRPEPPSLAPEPPYPVAPLPASRTATEPASPEASVRPRRRPLFGTIIWGVLLLALAGYVLLRVLLPTPADPTLWLLGGVIVIGVLLIVVGIIAALRRAG